MLKKYIFTPQQRIIGFLALWMTLFANQTFFKKLFYYAWEEKNYTVAFSAPFILVLLLVFVANVLLLLTHRYTFKTMIAFLLSVAALSSYFIDSFGTIIDKDMLNNMMQTDSAEVLDLITPKLLLYCAVGAIIPIIVLQRFPLAFAPYNVEVLHKLGVMLLALSLIVGLYMGLSKTYSSFFRNHHELKMYLNPYYPIASFIKYSLVKVKGKKSIIPIAEDAYQREHTRKKLVILLVGETARAENFSLNGYEKQTNPLLQSRNDIVNFSQFYSCGTATAISIPCMFSKFGRNAFDDDKNYYENLIDVIQKVGVNVVWRDNNSGGSKGIANRLSDVAYYHGTGFDEVLFKTLQTTIDEATTDTLIVLHQEGSHGPTYYKRYPEAFKRFTPSCDTQDLAQCSQEEIVNSYNNTIVYTDFIINEAIQVLEHNEEKFDTTLFYVSDHGESLGENGIYLHGLPYFIAPDSQKHVPALFYFGKSNDSKLERLRTQKSAHFSHDNLFHTMLGLFDIETKEYNANLDMLKQL